MNAPSGSHADTDVRAHHRTVISGMLQSAARSVWPKKNRTFGFGGNEGQAHMAAIADGRVGVDPPATFQAAAGGGLTVPGMRVDRVWRKSCRLPADKGIITAV